MDTDDAIAALAALSQPLRLEAFRLLVKHELTGLPSGEIAKLLGVPQNSMSTHLLILARSGLISSQRRSRQVIYRAELEQVRNLSEFLIEDCCGGRPELCAPSIASTSCCAPLEVLDVTANL